MSNPERPTLIFTAGLTDVLSEDLIVRSYLASDFGLENPSTHKFDYGPLFEAFERAGYNPVAHNPDWVNSSVQGWRSDLADHARELVGKNGSITFGAFSWGGPLSLAVAGDMIRAGNGPHVLGVAAIEPSCLVSNPFLLDGKLVNGPQFIDRILPTERAFHCLPMPDGTPRLHPQGYADIERHEVTAPGCPVQVYSSTEAMPIMQSAARDIAKLCSGELILFNGEGHSARHLAARTAVIEHLGRFLPIAAGQQR